MPASSSAGPAGSGRRPSSRYRALGRSSLVLLLATAGLAAVPSAAAAAPPASAGTPAAAAARFEQALPGFRVARVLWREGKLVLEHQGALVVLRAGDALPGRPLARLVQIDERGAVLREAAAAPGQEEAAGVPVPDRLVRLEPSSSAAGFSVTLLTAAEPGSPQPQREEPPAAQELTPGGSQPANERSHQAPLVPATGPGGGGR